jgi:hypothetical protein
MTNAIAILIAMPAFLRLPPNRNCRDEAEA